MGLNIVKTHLDFSDVSDLGLVFLLFMIGLEMERERARGEQSVRQEPPCESGREGAMRPGTEIQTEKMECVQTPRCRRHTARESTQRPGANCKVGTHEVPSGLISISMRR